MGNGTPEGSWFPESRERTDDGFEPIKISPAELKLFEERELPILKGITVRWTDIPECFLFAEFTLTPACGEAVSAVLEKYEWTYVEVRFDSGIKRYGKLDFPPFDHDDIEMPWHRAELSEWGRISYNDLVRWIKIRHILSDWSDRLTDFVKGRVGRVF